jgi:Holliday junction resolvase RusA-like endonuclease
MNKWRDGIPDNLKDRIINKDKPKITIIEPPLQIIDSSKKILILEEKLQFNNVPNKIRVGRKNIPFTMNAFYSQKHWMVRKKMVDYCKNYFYRNDIENKLHQLSLQLDKTLPIQIRTIIYRNTTRHDTDNVGGYWNKIILDIMKKTDCIKDDNMKYISDVMGSCRYHQEKEDKILIIITQYSRLDYEANY